MNDIDFNKIFLPHKEDFLVAVRSLVSEFREGIDFNRSAFPVFEDRLFWKQYHSINLMEKYIKNHLANGVLIDLLEKANYRIIHPKQEIIKSSPNVFDETAINYQFAILDDNNDTVVFVRFSDIPYDTSNITVVEEEVLSSHKIGHSKWIVLLWDDKEYLSDESHMLLKDFFEEFLTYKTHDLYVNNVRETIKEAETLIGYQTIIRFTTPNVHRLLYTQYISTIKKNYQDEKYSDISMDYFTPAEFKNVNRELSEQGKKDVFNAYSYDQRYLALIGTENYAKSFITAEFLFRTYKGDEYFDFTAIAACYAKSVEQLLLKVTMNYISEKNSNDSVIIRSKDKNKQQINFNNICINSKTTDEWKNQFNTLGSLNYFWLDNKDLTILSNSDRFESAALIHRFTFECRNQPFHSEALSWQDVERIRNNSLMILQMVLGAIKVKNSNGLGIIDDRFDRLISALIKPAKYANLLLFVFGEETIQARPEPFNLHAPIAYDSNKRIRSSMLKFVVIEAQNSTLKKGDTFTITEKHMPDKAYYRGKSGLVEIEW